MDRVVLDCELLLMPLERGEDVWLLGLELDYMKLLNGGSALLLTRGLLLAQMVHKYFNGQAEGFPVLPVTQLIKSR